MKTIIALLFTATAASASSVTVTTTFSRGNGDSMTLTETVQVPPDGKAIYTCAAKIKAQIKAQASNSQGFQSITFAECE